MANPNANVRLVPPAGATVSDFASVPGCSIQSDNSLYVPDPGWVEALVALGFKLYGTTLPTTQGAAGAAGAAGANGANAIRPAVETSASATPSATLNTYGSPVTITPPSGFTKFGALSEIDFTYGGTFGSETVTGSIHAVYSDASTSSEITGTGTSTGVHTTLSFAAGALDALFSATLDIVSFSFKIKSSLAAGSSIANATATVRGAATS